MRKCRPVNVSREDLREILPSDIFENLKKSYLIIQCEEASDLLAYALVQAGKSPSEVEIVYIDYIVEEQILEEVMNDLFQGVKDCLFQSGIKMIRFAWCDKTRRMDRLLRVMLKNGYLPVSLTGTVSEYSFEQLDRVKNLAELERVQKKGEYPFLAPGKEETLLKWFFRTLRERGIELSAGMYEEAYSRFYKVGDELKAYVIGAKRTESTLYFERVYMDGSQKGAIALTLMLLEILEAAKKEFSFDSHFFIYTDDVSIENLICVLLDEPMEVLQAHEYLCMNSKMIMSK